MQLRAERLFLSLVDCLFQLLPRREFHSLGGRNPDQLAVVGIVATTRSSMRDSEGSKSDECDLVALSQAVRDRSFERIYSSLSFGLCYRSRRRYTLDQIALVHLASQMLYTTAAMNTIWCMPL